jgi:hypothetical protein
LSHGDKPALATVIWPEPFHCTFARHDIKERFSITLKETYDRTLDAFSYGPDGISRGAGVLRVYQIETLAYRKDLDKIYKIASNPEVPKNRNLAIDIPTGYATFLITTSKGIVKWGALIIGSEYRRSETEMFMTTRLELVSNTNPFEQLTSLEPITVPPHQILVFTNAPIRYNLQKIHRVAANHPGRFSVMTGFPPSPDQITAMGASSVINPAITDAMSNIGKIALELTETAKDSFATDALIDIPMIWQKLFRGAGCEETVWKHVRK